jgi:hypothetical protein
MVAKFSGQDRAVVAAGVRSIIGESITLADVQKPLDFAYKYGVVDKHYDARDALEFCSRDVASLGETKYERRARHRIRNCTLRRGR